MSILTMYDAVTNLPRTCDTEGCLNEATSVWITSVMAGGATGSQRYTCDQHNPVSYTTPLPVNFLSQPLCHACGQPVNVGSLITP